MPRPDLSRVPEWYHGYIKAAEGEDLTAMLHNQQQTVTAFLASIPEDMRDYRYAPGKWTIRDLVQHINDGERVFAYRSLSFARFDPAPLPGFDENDWADNSGASTRNWDDLVAEFKSLRESSVLLFKSFSEAQLEASGTASDKSNYVRAFGFIMVGHLEHHVKIIKERYLS
ncbi:MAG: DinB family protein [Chitinophagaceae bacterium]|nr:DinB family protein [Chitinophagaceae bacterium]MBL0334273.1 DinB family protein [Chitinophagaceae bacterium]